LQTTAQGSALGRQPDAKAEYALILARSPSILLDSSSHHHTITPSHHHTEQAIDLKHRRSVRPPVVAPVTHKA
jgi:hypothetical protein|tara:strand:- start:44 stop:262 length:219 start_codon:yes stop_codon:yes gene_type:complete